MELVTHMVGEAARIVPGRLTFHWSHACTARPLCISLSQGMQLLAALSLGQRRPMRELSCSGQGLPGPEEAN